MTKDEESEKYKSKSWQYNISKRNQTQFKTYNHILSTSKNQVRVNLLSIKVFKRQLKRL